MRQTLHDYVIGFDSNAKSTRDALTDFAEKVTRFAKLTNRAPRLGDFVPCDEDGNVLKRPMAFNGGVTLDEEVEWCNRDNEYKQAKSSVIFKGDWEVVEGSNEQLTRIHSKQLNITIDFDPVRIGFVRTDKSGFVLERSYPTRIEDLPREIEFKEGVI